MWRGAESYTNSAMLSRAFHSCHSNAEIFDRQYMCMCVCVGMWVCMDADGRELSRLEKVIKYSCFHAMQMRTYSTEKSTLQNQFARIVINWRFPALISSKIHPRSALLNIVIYFWNYSHKISSTFRSNLNVFHIMCWNCDFTDDTSFIV